MPQLTIRLPHLGKTITIESSQSPWERSIAWLLAAEGKGGDASDPGGPTNYGWTLASLADLPAVLADFNNDGVVDIRDLKNMSEAQAASLYKIRFWDALHLDRLTPRLACALLDCAVNLGPARAVSLAQQAHNAAALPALTVDGRLGPLTLAALGNAKPGLADGLSSLRRAYYTRLADRSAPHKRYLGGWLNRLADLDVFLDAAFA